jgi:hypothetical protein
LAEGLEELPHVFRADSDARVDDLGVKERIIGADDDVDGSLFGKLDGVVGEVEKHLEAAASVSHHG